MTLQARTEFGRVSIAKTALVFERSPISWVKPAFALRIWSIAIVFGVRGVSFGVAF